MWTHTTRTHTHTSSPEIIHNVYVYVCSDSLRAHDAMHDRDPHDVDASFICDLEVIVIGIVPSRRTTQRSARFTHRPAASQPTVSIHCIRECPYVECVCEFRSAEITYQSDSSEVRRCLLAFVNRESCVVICRLERLCREIYYTIHNIQFRVHSTHACRA